MYMIRDDRSAELARMRDQGLLCLHEAERRQDRSGMIRWQTCVSQIELMLVGEERNRPPRRPSI